jgi:hypothetical protein
MLSQFCLILDALLRMLQGSYSNLRIPTFTLSLVEMELQFSCASFPGSTLTHSEEEARSLILAEFSLLCQKFYLELEWKSLESGWVQSSTARSKGT